MYYLLNENGEIEITSRLPVDGYQYTDEEIVVGYNHKLMLVSQTQTAEYITAKAAYDEQKAAEKQIASLKTKLNATDYQAIKYAEGQLSEEEYTAMKVQRQAWRDEINTLEAQLGIAPVNYLEGV